MGEDNRCDLSTLIERIACLGRLPEHLLWDAAKAMALDRSSSPGRRFARLVEAGAMLEAATLLVGQTRPGRAIVSIATRGRRWICVVDGSPAAARGMTRTYQAAHVDPAAAVLMALLLSVLDAPRATHDADAPRRKTQREFQHHDV